MNPYESYIMFIIAIIASFIAGAVLTNKKNQKKIASLKKVHQTEMSDEFKFAFKAGWDSVLEDHYLIRSTYKKLIEKDQKY